MGLQDFPKRGNSSIYTDEGNTRVPKEIRESDGLQWHKGQSLTWVKIPDEEYARVYASDKEPEDKD